ncbi:unnamed protein product [Ostreobium quekettii]|uniref:Uncharacterized protein n=1 Tax=Ostreobium quekettii TaxID=121088 RepID=A0A8S1ILD3_9CHLO|nr:unnamed protein product [Ostreobium quekettii]
MNSIELAKERQRSAEVEAAGGLDKFRRHALQHLWHGTTVKEAHASPVSCVSYNHASAESRNLFASVGGDQATVYRDDHLGGYVSILVQFTNEQTKLTKGGGLNACAWLNATGLHDPHQEDELLAVAGTDTNISIISIVEAQVTALLKGHMCQVIELVSARDAPGLFASLSSDGNIRVWDVFSQACVVSLDAQAQCMAMHPDGKYLVSGNKKGDIIMWPMSLSREGSCWQHSGPVLQPQALTLEGSKLRDMDCLLLLPGDRLAGKSLDGHVHVWDFEGKTTMAMFKVPDSGLGMTPGSHIRMSSSKDGDLLCIGNISGTIYIHDTNTGDRVISLSTTKCSSPVWSCAVSEHGDHVLASIGNSTILRYEYCRSDSDEASEEAVAVPEQGGDAMDMDQHRG